MNRASLQGPAYSGVPEYLGSRSFGSPSRRDRSLAHLRGFLPIRRPSNEQGRLSCARVALFRLGVRLSSGLRSSRPFAFAGHRLHAPKAGAADENSETALFRRSIGITRDAGDSGFRGCLSSRNRFSRHNGPRVHRRNFQVPIRRGSRFFIRCDVSLRFDRFDRTAEQYETLFCAVRETQWRSIDRSDLRTVFRSYHPGHE